ncbi:NAD-dependent epimerase/dehydratase family protein [Actinomadura madurae]|uniref:NAD-dependent epimerase/dehydratase family protein n=1 Tax=Actinomadura madurae TaxID=1993 RepID=UPI002026158A|nr:NAD-dependent epimerase/dehydratase family protein [Actinomadura madurae]URN04411.1 NAD-dependent epimerase/dehydratase family protein [Actinomadura madurae]
MRVLVVGSTGVIGRRLAPLLEAVGHEVSCLARPPASAVAVAKAAPDAVVNLLTATQRFHTEGTRTLYEAAQRACATRVLAQSLAYAYQPGTGLADEDAPLWTDRTPKRFAPVLRALIELERLTAEAGGLVLRYGHLYGPGSPYAPDGSFAARVRARKVPLLGGGHSTLSFTHADDAATAVVAALDKDVTGALNVVDDTPVTMGEFLPEYAALLDAPAPKHVPAILARHTRGSWNATFMNGLRGADNGRARRRLDWRPRHPSWRTGIQRPSLRAGQ